MKSKQVMLTRAARFDRKRSSPAHAIARITASLSVGLMLMLLQGCDTFHARRTGAEALAAPYATRRVWAVVPLRNESGSLEADGVKIADVLVHHLENAANLDVLPVNRVLAALEALHLPEVRTPTEVAMLRRTLNVDGLIIGSVTAYDPYDPPKLGLALELYSDPRSLQRDAPLDIRQLTRAATDEQSSLPDQPRPRQAAQTIVSAVFDASEPNVRKALERYAENRGGVEEKDAWRRYRVSMDLYSDYVGYVMCWRLLDQERQRIVALNPPPTPTPSR
jgi:hypothetical protein